jgi:hypothetical protein
MKFIHAKMTIIHMKSFIYGHIHPYRWIKITLNFKFQVQSFNLMFHAHAQTILEICQVPFHNPYGGLNGFHDLQLVTWFKLIDLQ